MSNLVANNVQNMKSMFEYCIRLRNLVFPKIFDVSNVVDTSFMFMNVRILSFKIYRYKIGNGKYEIYVQWYDDIEKTKFKFIKSRKINIYGSCF